MGVSENRPNPQLEEIKTWKSEDLTPEQRRMRRRILRNARGTKLRSKSTRAGVNKRKKR